MGKTKNTTQITMDELEPEKKKTKKSAPKQTATKKTSAKKAVQKNGMTISRVLLGIGLLALAVYSGWLIFHAPDVTGPELRDLQDEMGFLGGLIYILMHAVTGSGIILFPVLFGLTGLNGLSGRRLSAMQITGGIMAACAVLTALHMNVSYVDIKDNLLLGVSGIGGGVTGAVLSMILLKLLGKAGTCIVLAGTFAVAIILLVQGTSPARGEEFLEAVRDKLRQLKETLYHFIFIEEEEDEAPAEKTSKRKKEIKETAEPEKQKEPETPAKPENSVYQQEIVKEQEKYVQKQGLFDKVKQMFVSQQDETVQKRKPQEVNRYTESEYVVIPKEKPVILNNLMEIHKVLDEQEPRVGLSPREPLKQEKYLISDSVDEFQQILDKRQVNYTVTKTSHDEDKKPQKTELSAVKMHTVKDAVKDKTVISNPEAKQPDTKAAGQKPSLAKIEAAGELFPDETVVPGYQLPSIELLDINTAGKGGTERNDIMANVERLEKTLNDFGVKGKIADVSCGPAITQYEFQPAAGVKVSKIVGLSDDIALSMAVAGVRIEAPIPGKAAVGIEIPNKSTTMVGLRELIESEAFQNSSSKLTVALGKDISGQAIVADLAKMPHLLIAGSTGSGKSVCINTLINSILYKATPDEVKFVMVDPKKVELGNYNGIPHLISPVVTDAKKAAAALRWAVHEMDRRYEVFAGAGVKDMPRFNKLSEERLAAAQTEEEKEAIEIMPYIVVLIDELADLMMVAPADVEDAICRLAQLARAAGIHLVVATQRPSVDVITGIIKANMPSRIAFAVSSQTDSRTILDMGGAEKLLGRGDMLFYPTGMPKPQRVQGVYVSDGEIERITDAVKIQAQPVYNEEIGTASVQTETAGDQEEEWDDLIPEATKLFIENGQASISLLQRRFRVGYTRAARIVDQMEQRGLVGPYEGSKPRQIKVTMARYNEMVENGEL